LSKWKPEVSKECELCLVDDNIKHLLCDCVLAQSVWHKFEILQRRQVKPEDIILGHNETKQSNQIITILAFTIYKFWIQSSNENTPRTVTSLHALIKSDLIFRSKVYDNLRLPDLSYSLIQLADTF